MWSFDSAAQLDTRQLRREFLQTLRDHADDSESDFAAAELIYAELIGNCIRHAPGRVTIELEWDHDTLVLSVHDTVKAFTPNFSLPDNEFQEHGRGLYIVKALARSVQVESIAGDGSQIVAALPVKRKTAA